MRTTIRPQVNHHFGPAGDVASHLSQSHRATNAVDSPRWVKGSSSLLQKLLSMRWGEKREASRSVAAHNAPSRLHGVCKNPQVSVAVNEISASRHAAMSSIITNLGKPTTPVPSSPAIVAATGNLASHHADVEMARAAAKIIPVTRRMSEAASGPRSEIHAGDQHVGKLRVAAFAAMALTVLGTATAIYQTYAPEVSSEPNDIERVDREPSQIRLGILDGVLSQIRQDQANIDGLVRQEGLRAAEAALRQAIIDARNEIARTPAAQPQASQQRPRVARVDEGSPRPSVPPPGALALPSGGAMPFERMVEFGLVRPGVANPNDRYQQTQRFVPPPNSNPLNGGQGLWRGMQNPVHFGDMPRLPDVPQQNGGWRHQSQPTPILNLPGVPGFNPNAPIIGMRNFRENMTGYHAGHVEPKPWSQHPRFQREGHGYAPNPFR